MRSVKIDLRTRHNIEFPRYIELEKSLNRNELFQMEKIQLKKMNRKVALYAFRVDKHYKKTE